MGMNTEQEGGALASWTVMDTSTLRVQAEREGATLIVKAGGRVDGANAREFQDAIEDAIDESDLVVVLDLEELSYISSAGLRVILLVFKTLQRRSVKFGACSLPSAINEVFEVSGFDKIIPTYPSRAVAVTAL
jgi:anti-anti-sigma factor